MMMGSTRKWSLGVLAVAAAPALAAAASVSFEVGNAQLSMPVPSGFCMPEGVFEVVAEKTAETDSDNLTLATFNDCSQSEVGQGMDNYVIVKAPKMAVRHTFKKAEALAMLDAAGQSPEATRFDEDMADRLADRTEDTIGQRVELDGSLGYAGRDADCVYIAGRLYQKGNQSRVMQLAGCMTVVGGKLITVYRYDVRKGTRILDLKAQTRAIALSITAS